MTALLNTMTFPSLSGPAAHQRANGHTGAWRRRPAMRNLIDDVFVSVFHNPALAPLEDQARFPLAELAGLATGWPSPPIPMS